MNSNKLKMNIAASILLQVVTIISGFVLPKVILLNFGSSVNGLVSSINQFLSYVTLLEGGIGSVIMSILYKPLFEDDRQRVSQIVNSTISFFKALSIIYVVYAFALAFIYPYLVNTGFNYAYSVSLILVLALNLFFQYFLSVSYRLLLNADRRVAFVSLVQMTILLINLSGIIICTRIFKDLIAIKMLTAIVFILQPVAYSIYVHKHYKINKNDGFDEYTVKHRWDGLGINTAYFIHSNTDVVVLTIFTTLSDVSIYAIYLLIVKALKNLVSSISAAITPSLGNALASEDRETINKIFSAYEFGIGLITTLIFTCGMILITPFVDVYTLEIQDTNYHQTLFGSLIILSEMVYCYREPYISASYAAGHIKKVSKYAYIEAAINIVFSLILVNKFGIIGVAIGTIIAMSYRAIMQVYYLKHNIIFRSIKIFVKNMVINMIGMLLSIIVCYTILDMTVQTYINWIILAIKVGIIVSFFVIAPHLFMSRNMLYNFIKKTKIF